MHYALIPIYYSYSVSVILIPDVYTSLLVHLVLDAPASYT